MNWDATDALESESNWPRNGQMVAIWPIEHTRSPLSSLSHLRGISLEHNNENCFAAL